MPSPSLTALMGTLTCHVDLSKSRLEALALLLVGMIGARTVNLSYVANERWASIKVASTYRWFQRFFHHVDPSQDLAGNAASRPSPGVGRNHERAYGCPCHANGTAGLDRRSRQDGAIAWNYSWHPRHTVRPALPPILSRAAHRQRCHGGNTMAVWYEPDGVRQSNRGAEADRLIEANKKVVTGSRRQGRKGAEMYRHCEGG